MDDEQIIKTAIIGVGIILFAIGFFFSSVMVQITTNYEFSWTSFAYLLLITFIFAGSLIGYAAIVYKKYPLRG